MQGWLASGTTSERHVDVLLAPFQEYGGFSNDQTGTVRRLSRYVIL
jgi:hypothetical protein